MNVKERIHLKQKIAVKLGMDAHSPAIEVAKRYAESQQRTILVDDEILNSKAAALWLIVRINQKFDAVQR